VLPVTPVLLAQAGRQDEELSDEERSLTCSMQQNLLLERGRALNGQFVHFVAELLSRVLGRHPEVYERALLVARTCRSSALSLSSIRVTASAPTLLEASLPFLPANTIFVNQRGLPVSSNPVWNACIEQSGYVRDSEGMLVRCTRFYNSKHEWEYPDLLGVQIIYNPATGRMKLPKGIQTLLISEELEGAVREATLLRGAFRVHEVSHGYPLSSEEYWRLFFAMLPDAKLP
jgi:hypothetical protein